MIAGLHRPTQAIISLSHIIHNYETIKQSLPQKQLVYATVKANAYGHGAVAVSKTLSSYGVDGFCVALIDEGIELRQAGIKEPIIVLGLTHPSYALLLVDHHLSFTIGRLDDLHAVLDLLINNPRNNPAKIHLAFDSGMGRIGFTMLEELQEAVNLIAKHEDICILEGIYTHYATADSQEESARQKQKKQAREFISIKQQLKHDHLKHPILWHQSNSAMSIWYPNETMDMVRLGIALYGHNPSNGEEKLALKLKPALTWQTEIVHVKQMHANDTISYGATYQAKAGDWIATLPIGYADGLIRKASGFNLLVDDQRCPIVGRICMDQCMIAVPKAYAPGTKVTIIGKDDQHENTATDLARYLQTINYEVLCLISDRVPRYYEQGETCGNA